MLASGESAAGRASGAGIADQMHAAAAELQFELAARLRDELKAARDRLMEVGGG